MSKVNELADVTATKGGEAKSATLTTDQATVLLRQIKTKVGLEGLDQQDSKNQVAFNKLYCFASGGEKCMLYSGWLFAALSGATLPCMFFMLGPVFNSFTEESTPDDIANKIADLCIIMAILAVFVFVCSFFQNWFLMRASAGIGAKLKTQYLKAILNQESAWYDQTNYLELSSRIAKEVDSITEGIGRKYGNILYAYCMCLAGFTTGLYKGWSLSLAMLGIGPIMMIGMGCFGEVMKNRTIVSMRAYGQSAGYAEQALSAIKIVVSFGQETLEIKNYNRFLQRSWESGDKSALSIGMSTGFFNFSIYLCYGYAFLVGAYWIDRPYWNHAESRDYLAGDVIGCFFGVLIGLFSLGGAGPAITSVNIAKATGKVVFDIIDRKVPINQDDPNSRMIDLKGKIEFKNVQFYYPSRTDAPVMQGFDHVFEEGKTTAIVGPSGSGKSTTIQLVERFYDPTEGQIIVDGVNLKEHNLRYYRQQIGYVGQEPVMFNMTIKQNILMGKPDASDEEIIAALEAVNAWSFVQKYPNKINEHVGAGGGQLSGGQKQRIALARAFIKKPKMLIFDEATSALDKANEAIVNEAIEKLKKSLGSVTTLVIAHRLSTVRSADKIVVMKKGKKAEEGTHDELINIQNGIYAKLNAADQAASQTDAQKAAEPTEDLDAVDPAIMAQIHPGLLAATQENKEGRKGSRRMSAMPSIDIEATKEVDPVAKQKMKEANTNLKAANDQINADMDDLIDPKKQSKAFGELMTKYTYPMYAKIIGIFGVILFAIVSPMFGWWIMATMNALNEGYADRMIAQCIARGQVNPPCPPMVSDSGPFDRALFWCIMMIIASILIMVTKGVGDVMLKKVSNNMVTGVRKDLYEAMLRKDIGWHDDRDNSAGILTGTLASDVQLLSGVSSEGMGAQIEGAVAALAGTVMAFIFSWPLALVTIGLLPVFIICGAIQQKADQENMMNMESAEGSEEMEKSDDSKMSKLLCSDSITNYKTVASFGNDQLLLDQYEGINMRQAQAEDKSAKCYAVSLALSVSVNNGSFAILYIAMAELYRAYPTYKYTNFQEMNLAMFVFIFGAFTAAQSMAMGPDVVKATKAAMKIFGIVRRPSAVDTGNIPQGATPVPEKGFQGKIEFKDVWFRYPTRLQQWVFKGLNLTINPQDNIAVVGESGQGKSTFISLVMRFYDPEFGQVLIDGVNVKEMNVVELRQRLGLVQQEPLLFNYTLKENILYGRLDASNEEIEQAAKQANALEFIKKGESEVDLSAAVGDDPVEMQTAFKANEQMMKEMIAPEDYEDLAKGLAKLAQKAADSGKFEEITDLIDARDAATKGSFELDKGFDIFAGNKGSKLSGGQKQRIAIARAIIRNPRILLLDEATSALDEDSQRSVQEALYKIMGDRTSIVVAHRLTTVEKCNRLAVIDDGKIVEEGTFDDLKNKDGGVFSNMANGMKKAEEKAAKRASVLVTKPK